MNESGGTSKNTCCKFTTKKWMNRICDKWNFRFFSNFQLCVKFFLTPVAMIFVSLLSVWIPYKDLIYAALAMCVCLYASATSTFALLLKRYNAHIEKHPSKYLRQIHERKKNPRSMYSICKYCLIYASLLLKIDTWDFFLINKYGIRVKKFSKIKNTPNNLCHIYVCN